MGIINVKALVDLLNDNNHYTYMRTKNLLNGLKGRSTKEDIQKVRKVINKQLTTIDNMLAKLEKE